MNDRLPSRLERLWKHAELDRSPRLGLSLERVVQSGVELADTDGLGAVSMKRVAERLGFTTMSGGRRRASTPRSTDGVRGCNGGPASST
jgi:hypothetical protein